MSDAYTAKDVDRLRATIDYLRADNVRLLAELGEALCLVDSLRARIEAVRAALMDERSDDRWAREHALAALAAVPPETPKEQQ